jgi:WD40 repeat protein
MFSNSLKNLGFGAIAIIVAAWSACGCGGAGVRTSAGSDDELLVGSSNNGEILRYSLRTGAYVGVFASGGSLISPEGMGQLTSGDIVVGDYVTDHVLQYTSDGTFVADLGALNGTPYGLLPLSSGEFLVSVFDSVNPATGAKTGQVVKYTPAGGFQTFIQDGNLNGPDGLVIGLDGLLYVSSQRSAQVLRYDLNGNFKGIFASGAPLGLPNAGPSGIAFGPDGNLYVAQHDTNPVATTNGMVLRYNGTTGAFIDQAVPQHEAGLSGPVGVLFTPNRRLIVTSCATNQILDYSVMGTGSGVFCSSPNLNGPIYMARVHR